MKQNLGELDLKKVLPILKCARFQPILRRLPQFELRTRAAILPSFLGVILSSSIFIIYVIDSFVLIIKVFICYAYLFNCNINGRPLGKQHSLKGHPPKIK